MTYTVYTPKTLNDATLTSVIKPYGKRLKIETFQEITNPVYVQNKLGHTYLTKEILAGKIVRVHTNFVIDTLPTFQQFIDDGVPEHSLMKFIVKNDSSVSMGFNVAAGNMQIGNNSIPAQQTRMYTLIFHDTYYELQSQITTDATVSVKAVENIKMYVESSGSTYFTIDHLLNGSIVRVTSTNSSVIDDYLPTMTVIRDFFTNQLQGSKYILYTFRFTITNETTNSTVLNLSFDIQNDANYNYIYNGGRTVHPRSSRTFDLEYRYNSVTDTHTLVLTSGFAFIEPPIILQSGESTQYSLYLDNTLEIADDLTVAGNINSNNLTLDNNLTVSNTSSLQSLSAADVTCTTLTGTDITCTSITTSSADINGNLTCTGTATANDLNISNTVTSATLNTQNVLTSTLIVNNSTELLSLVVKNGTSLQRLAVSNTTTLGELIAGLTTLKELTCTGTLTVTGASTLAALTAAATTLTSLTCTNNATVGGTLGVTGTTTLGTANINTMNSTFAVLGIASATTMNSGSTTVSSLTCSGNATVSGTLGVTGTTTLGVLNTGNTAVTGTLSTSGAATLNSLTCTNNATVGGTLGVTGTSTLGTLNTTGTATLNSLTCTNNATVGGTLGVTGTTTVGVLNAGNSAITGTLSTSGAATLNSLTCTNNATVGGTLGVTGATTLGVLNAGNTAVTGTLSTSGAATLNSLSCTNNATVGGTLSVTGASTMTELMCTVGAYIESAVGTSLYFVGVDHTIGAISIQAGNVGIGQANPTSRLHVEGTGNITGNTIIGGTLGVTGTTTVGVLNAGNTAVTGTLSTTGAATLNSLTCTNNATVGGTLGVTGATTLTGATTVSSINTTTHGGLGAGVLRVGYNAGLGQLVLERSGTGTPVYMYSDANSAFHFVQGSQGTVFTVNSATFSLSRNLAVTGTSTVTGNCNFGSSGNVGIGSGTPLTKLDVNGSSVQRNPFYYNTNSTIRLHPAWDGTNNHSYFVFQRDALSTDPNDILDFQIANASHSIITTRLNRHLCLNPSNTGSVAIGTTTPLTKFDCRGNVGVQNSLLFARIGAINYIQSGTTIGTVSDADLYFTNMNGGTVHMVILGTGNVGIGLTAPTSKLHVSGTANITGNTTVGGTLGVTGTTTVGVLNTGNTAVTGTLSTSGAATLNSLTCTNNATVGGTLSVTGVMTTSAALRSRGTMTTRMAPTTSLTDTNFTFALADIESGFITFTNFSANRIGTIPALATFTAAGYTTNDVLEFYVSLTGHAFTLTVDSSGTQRSTNSTKVQTANTTRRYKLWLTATNVRCFHCEEYVDV